MSKSGKNIFWILILILASLFLGFYFGKLSRYPLVQNRLFKSNQNKINETLDVIEQSYVDDVDIKDLTEKAVGNLLTELDPHSSYIPAAEVESANEDLSASFSGIGVQFNMQTDTILVISVLSGGPAEKAGLMAFDKIITVDDTVVAGKKLGTTKVMKMLRGKKDSKVRLGIQRGDTETLTEFELTRGDIPNHTVDVSYMLTETVGFIKITKFGTSTYREFITAIAKLKKEGAKGFIVDLRDNPGGYMETAIRMINEFLPKGQLIVYMEGKAYPRRDTYSDGRGSCPNDPIVVLINELSGSASEIFSGAMQDNDRGLIIGRRSYGKGLVQVNIDLSDKSQLHLTIGRYYTPSGRCIQKSYEMGNAEEYANELNNRYLHHEFDIVDSIKQIDSLQYSTIGGRTVYGGGGIMPDIFIPRDTAGMTTYYWNVINTGILYQYSLSYSDQNKEKMKSFSNYQELYKYLKSQNLIYKFTDYAASMGIKKRPNLISISNDLIEKQIIAYIVRNFFDDDGFYPIFYMDDQSIKKAIEVLENGDWNPKKMFGNGQKEAASTNSPSEKGTYLRRTEKAVRNYLSKID